MFSVLMVFAGLMVSCNPDPAPVVNFDAEFLPVVDVDVPESMHTDTTYAIKLYYRRPTDCYYYNGFSTEQDGNEFKIAIQSIVLADNNCQPLQYLDPEVATFEFECPHSSFDHYTFYFYTGENTDGTKNYMEVTVPVQM